MSRTRLRLAAFKQEGRLDLYAAADAHGDELRFHLATSPEFRAALMRRGPRASRRPTQTVQQHLARYASLALRKTLPPL